MEEKRRKEESDRQEGRGNGKVCGDPHHDSLKDRRPLLVVDTSVLFSHTFYTVISCMKSSFHAF